jgi:hypothetical protein
VLKLPARISLVLTALVLITGMAAASAANALSEPKSGLAISPPTFELSANAGDTLKNSLRVDNISNEPLEVSVDTRNFTAMGEEGGINLSEEEGDYSLASWISVTPEKVTIPAGESKVFDYVIDIPSNASPGGRFGSVIFKTALKPVSGQSGVAVGQEVGALVFLKIAGEVNEKAGIVSFGARNGLNESGPVGFDIRVKNTGNVQVKPRGTITVSNVFGNKVASVPVDEKNVLPGAIRKLSAEWNNGWLFGKYNATLSLVYGSDRQVLTASTTFWGFPYKLIGIVVVALIVLAAMVYPRRKRIGRAFKVLFGKD